jgi:hypothetical protein
MAVKSRMGLPYSIGRVRVLGSPAHAGTRLCGIAAPRGDGSFDARVVDENGRIYIALEGYRTMEVPDPIDGEALRPLRDCIGDAPAI